MIKVIGVRFRKAGKVYYFDPAQMEIKMGDHVIVETARGIEFGEVVLGVREVDEKKVIQPLKSVIRMATKNDEELERKNKEKEHEAFQICQEKIRKHELQMKLIDAEYTFDNNKLLFYFTADGRIDFRELVKDLRRNGVERALQRLADGDDTVVAAAGVFRVPARAGQLDVRRVVDLRILRDEAELHRGTVGRDRLDGRSGRTLGLRGAVCAEVDGLFARTAGQALDLAGVGIHDDDGGLELLAGGRRALRHVVEVGIDVVDRLLDARIVAGIDLIAAGIEQRARRVAADALLLDEVVEHVVDDGLGIVAVDGLGGLVGFAANEHELLRHGLIVLLLVDPALLIHLLEDGLLPGFIVLAADEGVVLRGVVRDADDARALGEREVLRLLAEVGLGGGVDAVAALAEVDDVEVPLHDLFLIIGLLEFERLEDLEQLALHGDIVLLGEVFDELLRDGRAAEVVFHRQEHVDKRPRRAVPVHALVLIKALVLDGDGRMLHVLGNVGIVDPDAVFRTREIREVLPVAVGVLIQDRARE